MVHPIITHMKLPKFLRNLIRPSKPALPPLPPPEPELAEIEVPEITSTDLMTQLAKNAGQDASSLLLLDVREPYEWRQVHMVNAIHIPMNEVPNRVAELSIDADIVVICAHGQRSYGVAAYLIEQGYRACSLAGGITSWAIEGGAVVMQTG